MDYRVGKKMIMISKVDAEKRERAIRLLAYRKAGRKDKSSDRRI
jgi:hypothetical protein